MTRLSVKITEWIEEFFTENPSTEVAWDLAWQMQPEPMLVVVLFMPGALLGTGFHSTAAVTGPLGFTKDACHTLLRQMLEALRQQRTTQLQQTLQQNGHPLN